MAIIKEHKVEITHASGDKDLIVTWNGFKCRHDYIVAENIDDLDLLVTELSQAVYNYRRKTQIYRHVKK